VREKNSGAREKKSPTVSTGLLWGDPGGEQGPGGKSNPCSRIVLPVKKKKAAKLRPGGGGGRGMGL